MLWYLTTVTINNYYSVINDCDNDNSLSKFISRTTCTDVFFYVGIEKQTIEKY